MGQKKNFASSFMSTNPKESSDKETVVNEEVSDTEKKKFTVQPNETKTRRVQLLLKPSDYDKLKEVAERNNCSVNRVIENLVSSYL